MGGCLVYRDGGRVEDGTISVESRHFVEFVSMPLIYPHPGEDGGDCGQFRVRPPFRLVLPRLG